MSIEVARHGTTVNAFAHGILGTAMWDQVDEEMGKMKGVPKDETIKKYSSDLIALARTSVRQDVAKTVSSFAGGDSDHSTGQIIVIDGVVVFTWTSELVLHNHLKNNFLRPVSLPLRHATSSRDPW